MEGERKRVVVEMRNSGSGVREGARGKGSLTSVCVFLESDGVRWR